MHITPAAFVRLIYSVVFVAPKFTFSITQMGLQQITVMSPNIELNLTAWYLSTNTLGGAFTLFLILPLGMLGISAACLGDCSLPVDWY